MMDTQLAPGHDRLRVAEVCSNATVVRQRRRMSMLICRRDRCDGCHEDRALEPLGLRSTAGGIFGLRCLHVMVTPPSYELCRCGELWVDFLIDGFFIYRSYNVYLQIKHCPTSRRKISLYR